MPPRWPCEPNRVGRAFLAGYWPSPGRGGHQAIPGIAACCFGRPWALPDIEPVNALVALAYSPLLRWCLHPPLAGVITPVALVSAYCDAACDTLSSQSWHLSWPCAGVLVCLALAPCQRCAGIVALVCCSRRAGVPASIVLASSPFTRWRRCLRCAGFITLVALASSHWRCCLQHIVIAELASLPRLR